MALYERMTNGTITRARDSATAGRDCLDGRPDLQQTRDEQFWNNVVPMMDVVVRRFFGLPVGAQVDNQKRTAYVFATMVNWNFRPMHSLVLAHINLSERFFVRHMRGANGNN